MCLILYLNNNIHQIAILSMISMRNRPSIHHEDKLFFMFVILHVCNLVHKFFVYYYLVECCQV